MFFCRQGADMSELQNLVWVCEVRSSPFLGSNSILKAI